jgi:autotransporter-associated beta strand protein
VLTGVWTLTGHARMGARGSEAENIHYTDPLQRGAMWTGKITGNFNLELNIENGRNTNTTLDGNTPTMIIASPLNDWGGNTTIGSGRTRLGNPDAPGAGEVIPHGAGKGNVTLLGETARELTILTLDSRTETINGLSSTGDLSTIFITNSTEGEATLRVGANNASSTFGGVITDHTGKIHVTKIGSGSQSFTGVNAYTGDTRIEGGTLSITSGTLSSSADVYMNSSAVFDLAFPGQNTIDSLFIDGVGQAIGTWGSLSSTAFNKRSFFTGNGVLNVSSVGEGSIPGDFDGDQDVDGQDLTGSPNGFNARFGNDLEGDDFLAWQRNFGTNDQAIASSSPVPEPHSLSLLMLAGYGFARARPRAAA